MDTITINESKKIQTDILIFLDKFCRDNGIRYSLYAGTLIGAVRHQGFIPWDDDIDILVPRSDYNILVEIFNDKSSIYKLHSLETDDEYCYPFAKVEDTRTLLIEHVNTPRIGVAIDVYPFDYVGNDYNEYKKFIKRIGFLKQLHKAKLIKPTKRISLSKRVSVYLIKALLSLVSLRTLAQWVSNYAKRLTVPSIYSADIVSGWGLKEVLPSAVFEDFVELPFENKQFMAIKDYALYLKSTFGDYMQLPPEDKRVSPHTLDSIYWK